MIFNDSPQNFFQKLGSVQRRPLRVGVWSADKRALLLIQSGFARRYAGATRGCRQDWRADRRPPLGDAEQFRAPIGGRHWGKQWCLGVR